MKDQVPRVVAHCLASLTNFLENCTPEYIQPHFQYLYQCIMENLNNGISFVREACLSALSALAEGSESLFDPHYDEVMKIVFTILENSQQP